VSLIEQLAQEIATAVRKDDGGDFVCTDHQSIGGGCINSAYRLDSKSTSYFVKVNAANMLDMFSAEAAGLKAIADTHTIHVPTPLCHGMVDNQSYIAMEFLNSGGSRNNQLLGEQLAAMHQSTSDTFGWHIDNTIGSTPQINTPDSDWVSFWQQQRLGYQLRLAKQKGYGGTLQSEGEKLLGKISDFFTDYQPTPSLIHGDLWNGNYTFTRSSTPTIFDPAVYYADREVEIAMTELFGGFGSEFYAAYNAAWPLDAGYSVRKELYNLYHIINHLNLFGGGYKAQAESMIGKLLREAR